MGFFAEKTAADHKISREDNDKYAISSYEKAIEAQKNKLFLNEIVPVKPKDNSGEEVIRPSATRPNTYFFMASWGGRSSPAAELAASSPLSK